MRNGHKRTPAVIQTSTARQLADKAFVADSLWMRMKGLLGRSTLPDGEALVFPRCRSIHTYGMRFPIDAIFVDHSWRIVALKRALGPWRVVLPVLNAWGVVEVAHGTIDRIGLSVGDRLNLIAPGSEDGALCHMPSPAGLFLAPVSPLANMLDAFRRYAYSVILYTTGVLIYLTNPYYQRSLLPETQLVLAALLFIYVLFGFPCQLLSRGKRVEQHPGYILVNSLGRFAKESVRYFRHFPVDPDYPAPRLEPAERTVCLFALVKLFWNPVMLNFAVIHGKALLEQFPRLFLPELWRDWMAFSLNGVYPLLLSLIFFVDTMYFSFGYLVESRRLGNMVKSVEPTVLGWVVALACYPPFSKLLHTYFPSWAPSDHVYFWSDTVTLGLRAVILGLLLVYLWATLSLGAKCSNLTNRGIVMGGAYGLVRHPAYAAKVLTWWIMLLPVLSVPAFASLAAVTGIYYLRAITEERHLLRDPDYQDYCRKVRDRFIPGVC